MKCNIRDTQEQLCRDTRNYCVAKNSSSFENRPDDEIELIAADTLAHTT
jgi:hypothetical protein